jgi:uncharacterized protein YeaO (DUF488 family)
MSIKVKRVYAAPSRSDGIRILVDRVWPRGMTKVRARLDEWLRQIAPSDALRKWFNHEPERWEGFEMKYWKELEQSSKAELVDHLRNLSLRRTVTLLYGAHDEEHNQAVALSEFLRKTGAKHHGPKA